TAAEEHRLGNLELKMAGRDIGAAKLFQNPFRKVVAAELGSRGVDRDAAELDPAIEPGAHVGDDPFYHPVADLSGDVGVFESGLDGAGRADTAVRVTPAQQRFKADKRAGRDVELGLVVADDAVVLDRVASLLDHRDAALDVVAHVRLEDGDEAAPGSFGRRAGTAGGLG